MDTAVSILLGERSPDWVLPLLDSGELRLSSLRDQRVLLFFWASW
ncbi:MAG: peroxiredoxin family protein [Chloroflexota bacterium]|nr:peroxiredoxin family protein [Chloroflexota bacterium]